MSPGFTLVETLEKGTQCISTFVEKEVKIMAERAEKENQAVQPIDPKKQSLEEIEKILEKSKCGVD